MFYKVLAYGRTPPKARTPQHAYCHTCLNDRSIGFDGMEASDAVSFAQFRASNLDSHQIEQKELSTITYTATWHTKGAKPPMARRRRPMLVKDQAPWRGGTGGAGGTGEDANRHWGRISWRRLGVASGPTTIAKNGPNRNIAVSGSSTMLLLMMKAMP